MGNVQFGCAMLAETRTGLKKGRSKGEVVLLDVSKTIGVDKGEGDRMRLDRVER